MAPSWDERMKEREKGRKRERKDERKKAIHDIKVHGPASAPPITVSTIIDTFGNGARITGWAGPGCLSSCARTASSGGDGRARYRVTKRAGGDGCVCYVRWKFGGVECGREPWSDLRVVSSCSHPKRSPGANVL